jgi:hypothetical protein
MKRIAAEWLEGGREGATGTLGRQTKLKLSLAKVVPIYWEEKEKDKQCACNVIFRRYRLTVVSVV